MIGCALVIRGCYVTRTFPGLKGLLKARMSLCGLPDGFPMGFCSFSFIPLMKTSLSVSGLRRSVIYVTQRFMADHRLIFANLHFHRHFYSLIPGDCW